MTQQPPRNLEMATRKKSSALPVTIIIALLALCGGGAWYMLTKDEGPISTEAPASLSSSGQASSVPGTDRGSMAGETRLPGEGRTSRETGLPGERAASGFGTENSFGGTGAGAVSEAARRESFDLENKAPRPEDLLPGEGGASGRADGLAAAPASQEPIPASVAAQRAAQSALQPAQPARQAAGKEDSGNIVEPPAGSTYTLPSGSGGSTGGTQAAGNMFDKRERSLAAVEAALERNDADFTPEEGLPSSGGSFGGELDGGADDGSVGTLAAEASDIGDSVITPFFVRDLARWMVDHYTPGTKKGEKGKISASLSAANATFGQSMSGLRYIGEDSSGARAFVLDHVWSPGMLEALYRMYDDSFVQAMRSAAARRNRGALNGEQTADMLRAYAGLFRLLDAGLRGVAGTDDLGARMKELRQTEQNIAGARKELTALVHRYERAVEDQEHALAQELRGQMEMTATTIQEESAARARAERSLADEIRRRAEGRTPDDATLLYLAQWVERRGSDQDTALVAAGLLGRMADRLDAEAE